VPLRPREFGLLRMFLENADRVVLVEDLLERFWGTRERTSRNVNSLSVHVKRLRTRLGDDCADPCLLVTVRGIGYRLLDAAG
jgi:two-component system response regulator RegX3